MLRIFLFYIFFLRLLLLSLLFCANRTILITLKNRSNLHITGNNDIIIVIEYMYIQVYHCKSRGNVLICSLLLLRCLSFYLRFKRQSKRYENEIHTFDKQLKHLFRKNRRNYMHEKKITQVFAVQQR